MWKIRFRKSIVVSLVLGIIASIVLLFSRMTSVNAANNDVVCMEYDDGAVCVELDISSRDYEFRIFVWEYNKSGSPSLYCEIRHSSSQSALFEDCTDTIRYTGSDGDFIVTATLNNEDGTFFYNIDDEEWEFQFDEVDVDDLNGNTNSNGWSSNSNNDWDDIRITTNSSDHDLNEYIDVEIKILDDGDVNESFRDKIRFEVEKKNSNWSRVNASSSDYTLAMSSYTFTSSDDGEKTFNNLVKFKNDWTYRLRAYFDDDDNVEDFENITIGSSNNNNNWSDEAVEFKVTAENDELNEDERSKIYIKAIDEDGNWAHDYRNTVEFEVYRRSSSNGSWSNITNSSSNNSNYKISDHEYTFTSADDGFENDGDVYIEFKNDSYDYKVTVVDEDDNDIEGYVIFYLKSSSPSNSDEDIDAFKIIADDDTPNENQKVYFTIEAQNGDRDVLEDYRDGVEFLVYRRSSVNATWENITSTDDDNSKYEISDHTYTFTSSDDGISDEKVWFRPKSRFFDYKVVVRDRDDINADWYEVLYLVSNPSDDDSNNEDADKINISTTDNYPDINDDLWITVEVVDNNNRRISNFDDTVNFTISYLDGSSYKKTTSSVYYEMDEDDYKFRVSDNGRKVFIWFLKFKKALKYKLEVEAEDSWAKWSIVFTVGDAGELNTTTSSADNFLVDVLTKEVAKWDYVDVAVTARTDDNERSTTYTDTVSFKVREIRSLTNNSWVVPNNGDYNLALSTYTFKSSDSGLRTFNDLLKVNENGYYKIYVENSIEWYSYVFAPRTIYDNSVAWFSSSELAQVRTYYKVWPAVINALLKKYPRLVDNSSWELSWIKFYDKLSKTVQDQSWRFTRYSTFQSEIRDWVQDTLDEV